MSWVIPKKNYLVYAKDAAAGRLSSGIGVWSLQKALNQVASSGLITDGFFGPATDLAVRRFQSVSGLASDGIAGAATQKALVFEIVALRQAQSPKVPDGMLRGFVEGEGGYWMANTNWSVTGGVDCGAFQRRVYEPDYGDDAVVQRAFNTQYQADLLADSLFDRRLAWIDDPGTNDGFGGMGAVEKAWRLAALNHNYPSGASRLASTPILQLSSYWRAEQDWVIKVGALFPDGTRVMTPLQWCHRYAGVLGEGRYGTSGMVTKYVKVWG